MFDPSWPVTWKTRCSRSTVLKKNVVASTQEEVNSGNGICKKVGQAESKVEGFQGKEPLAGFCCVTSAGRVSKVSKE